MSERFNIRNCAHKFDPLCSGCGKKHDWLIQCPPIVCEDDPCLEVRPYFCKECCQKLNEAGALIRLA
jgi:hypothetical protein